MIVNITKYAMPHTRVYIDMKETEQDVRISMKNVSSAELNFNTDEITDRFVRGDVSRNTEGSGLGLAIVKSFVELQYGTLQISTEADLFSAFRASSRRDYPSAGNRRSDHASGDSVSEIFRGDDNRRRADDHCKPWAWHSYDQSSFFE